MASEEAFESAQAFRLDVPLHTLLTQPTTPPPGLRPLGQPQMFPDPVFPQHPELLGEIDYSDEWVPPEKRRWTPGQIYHVMQGWLFPYIRSRVTTGDFHPLGIGVGFAAFVGGVMIEAGYQLYLALTGRETEQDHLEE